MTDAELLVRVKSLNDYGENDYADDKLTEAIIWAKGYLKRAGLKDEVINSDECVGIIAHMVDDYNKRRGISQFVRDSIAQIIMTGGGTGV